MKRAPYVIRTVLALAAAYLAFRIAFNMKGDWGIFPSAWHFLDPLRLIGTEGRALHGTILLHVLLTVVLVHLSVQRAWDAGWRSWTGMLMILPVVRLFVFVALAIVPSAGHVSAMDLPRTTWLHRVLPVSRLGNALAAIGLTVALVVPLGFMNVRMLQDYGLALFIGLPFILGTMSAFLYGQHRARSWRESTGIAMLTMTVALAAIFIFAMEGLLCIAMAAPIVYAIAFAGALIGHSLAQRSSGSSTAMSLMVLLAPGLMAFEATHPCEEPLFKVSTSLEVKAAPQAVWDRLVAFSHMSEPDEILFRAGISYPIEARIEGTGVGACRYCWFNTGPFVEPITVWDEPRMLAFDVLDDPPPMTELSIYDRIDAPHVDGFFHSRKGQFLLRQLPNGSTWLQGTTWYTHDIWPAWYWRLWSDAILHRIHRRVLEHIRDETENGSVIGPEATAAHVPPALQATASTGIPRW